MDIIFHMNVVSESPDSQIGYVKIGVSNANFTPVEGMEFVESAHEQVRIVSTARFVLENKVWEVELEDAKFSDRHEASRALENYEEFGWTVIKTKSFLENS